jgi:hypothetical protein
MKIDREVWWIFNYLGSAFLPEAEHLSLITMFFLFSIKLPDE